MSRTQLLTLFAVLPLALIGCPDDPSDGAEVVESKDETAGGTGSEVDGTGENTTGSDGGTTASTGDPDGATGGTAGTGEEVPDATKDGEDAEEDNLNLPDDFNEPCETNKGCDAGFCVNGPDGKVCTATCFDSCPDKWTCEQLTNAGQDVTFVCIPQFVSMCTACTDTLDCGPDARCVEVAPEGNFCARACSVAEPCPTGFLCKDDGDGENFCFPTTGSCICTADIIGEERECFLENPFGICRGVETCAGPGGWSVCTAPVPASEVCDGLDNDCNNQVDEFQGGAACNLKNEFGTCFGTFECLGEDGLNCSATPPAAETCGDGVDNNCDGSIDDAGAVGCTEFFEDIDKDGLGNALSKACLCQPTGNFTANLPGDCNDLSPIVGEGKVEVCNQLDDNCDGLVDPEGSIGCKFFFKDADQDGYGATTDTKCLCAPTGAYTASQGGDCLDENALASPIGSEVCNGIDDNCNGIADEPNAVGCKPYMKDFDSDGYGVTGLHKCLCEPDDVFKATLFGDCNDKDATAHPNATEICDGIDNSCNGQVDGGCDLDSDGYCNALKPIVGSPAVCPHGGGDCNDLDHSVNPGATEHCNNVDDNCDGTKDEGVKAPCGGCAVVCLMDAGPASTDEDFTGDETAFDGTGKDTDGNVVLDSTNISLNMIWISNSGEGSVSKINTSTGKEVSRYKICNDPSRTAVDSQGNVWIGCRGDAKAVKIMLSVDECIDKNGNGQIDTSLDDNGDGVIQPNEMEPQDTDECVLFAVQPDVSSAIARAVAVDKDDHGWVGMWNTPHMWKLHRDTGDVLQMINIGGNRGSCGFAIDQQGVIWISARKTGELLRVDPNKPSDVQSFQINAATSLYGMTIDENGKIWLCNWSGDQTLYRFDPLTKQWAGVKLDRPRGVAANGNGYVFSTNDNTGRVHKININTLGVEGVIDLGSNRGPIGAAVDFDGKVWAINRTTHTASRIEPSDMSLIFETPTGPAPYTYSDMTGFQQKTIVAPQGKYRHVFQGWQTGFTKWVQVSLELTTPEGTSADIRVRAAQTKEELEVALWSPFFGPFPEKAPTVNLEQFGAVIGQFMEVEVQLFSQNNNTTPILKSLDVVASPL